MRPAWAVVTWYRLLVVQTMTELNEHLGHADHGDNDRHIGNRHLDRGGGGLRRAAPPAAATSRAVRYRTDADRQVDHKASMLGAAVSLLGAGAACRVDSERALGRDLCRGPLWRASRRLPPIARLREAPRLLVLDHYLEVLVCKPGALPK